MVRYRFSALLLLTALLGGCFLPIFDLGTSLAYQTASKMTKIGTVGPIEEYSRDRFSAGAEIYYVPSRMLPPNHGLLVVSDTSGIIVSYLAPDPSEPGNPVRRLGDEVKKLFDNGDPGSFGSVVAPIIDNDPTPSADAYFIATGAGDDAEFTILTYDGAENTTENSENALVLPIAPLPTAGAKVLGVSVDLVNSPPGFAEYLLLIRDSAASPLELFRGTVIDANDPAPGTLPRALPSALPSGFDTVGGAAAFSFADDTYVFSDYAGGGFYDVYRWAPLTGEPELLPVRQSIDAILATGELYHRGANSDEVYDANGRRKYSIPTGKLHFAYEITVATVPTMFYTLVYFDQVSRDSKMYIDIYAIPTANLGDLE